MCIRFATLRPIGGHLGPLPEEFGAFLGGFHNSQHKFLAGYKEILIQIDSDSLLIPQRS